MITPRRSSSSVRVFYPRFNRIQLVGLLKEGVQSLRERLPLRLVVLFGSYARGNFTVASDIDLLVVYEGESRDNAFAVTKKTIAIRGLEPHVYTAEEYGDLKGTIDKMIQGGIVLFPASTSGTC